MGKKKTLTPFQVEQRMKRERAMRLRGERRMTYQQIADEMNLCDKSAAHNLVKRGLQETMTEAADSVRAMELEQLDHLYRCLETRILNGEEKAINAALRIQERRAKLLGLDAPVKTAITGDAFKVVIDPEWLPEGANIDAVDSSGDG